MTYQEWMNQVNSILISRVGVSADDLEDFCSRDCYDDDLSPMDGAIEAIENSDTAQSFGISLE